jgi:hypothetical protein
MTRMKRVTVLFVLAVFFLSPLLALAASSVIATPTWVAGQNMKVIKVSWVAEHTQDVDGAATVPYTELKPLNGFIYAIQTDPGATAPTDNYDVYLRDYTTGVSLLGTSLENRDTVNSELVVPSVPVYTAGAVGFSLSGNTNIDAVGDVYIYVGLGK